jgi:HPr kinase/phosphorylase
MNDNTTLSIHASAVRVGSRAILIRGPSGSGKSRLAFDLIVAGGAGQIPAATLIGDDRVHLLRTGDELLVRGIAALAGLIEIRGLGLRRCDFVKEAALGLVVDLAAADAERMPPATALHTQLHGIKIPRIPIGSSYSALPLVLAALLTTPNTSADPQPSHDCRKGFDNHIRPTIATD